MLTGLPLHSPCSDVGQMLYFKKRAMELLHAQRQFKALGELLKVRGMAHITPTAGHHTRPPPICLPLILNLTIQPALP